MGSSDNFCLRWNDFESNISTSFRELREDSEFLDVTLCCDNGVDIVQAHKVILAACSPLFRKILSRQKNQQNPFLYLKGIRLKELRAVLDFIYHGEVNVAQDSLNNFLAVAEELAIKGLTTDSQKPGGGPDPAGEQRKKAVAKRKSVPPSAPVQLQTPVQAKKPKTDDDVVGLEEHEHVDVKGIKAEPEPSGSGQAPNVPMVEADLDDSYGGGAEGDDNGDFGGGEDFEGFDQYGDGQDFDDSMGAAGASASAGADGKGSLNSSVTDELENKENCSISANMKSDNCSETENSGAKPGCLMEGADIYLVDGTDQRMKDPQGFEYRVKYFGLSKIYWQCTYRSCKAIAITDGGTIYAKYNRHAHCKIDK